MEGMLDTLRTDRQQQAPPWLVLAIACTGQFMVVLDVSVVNVALPSMRTALGFDPAGLQWVVNAYALTFAGFLLLGGRIADLFGRKRVFVIGLALFSVASLAGGLADTPGLLVAARAVQGVGAAVLAPATLTIITTAFPDGPAKAKALGTWTAVGAAGGAAGSLVGGVLTEYLSWRWILLINVPIGAIAIVAALVALVESTRTDGHLDIPGAVLVTAGLAALTYGIVQTHDHGWGSAAVLIPMIAGLLALAAFVIVEQRFARAPLVPMRLFRSRRVTAGNLVMLLLGVVFFAMWYFLSLYMQNVLHYSAVRTGLAFIPHTATIIVAARLAPVLMRRVPLKPLIITGAAIAAAGFLWQAQLTPSSGFMTGILAPGILMCFGAGLMMTPVAATVTSGVPAGEAGLASGLLNAARQVGGSLGLATLATIATRRTQTLSLYDSDPAKALTSGYAQAFAVSAGVLVLVAAVALALPTRYDTPEPVGLATDE
jgi:EmrB/QacA subfamily drug resistance transporter